MQREAAVEHFVLHRGFSDFRNIDGTDLRQNQSSSVLISGSCSVRFASSLAIFCLHVPLWPLWLTPLGYLPYAIFYGLGPLPATLIVSLDALLVV